MIINLQDVTTYCCTSTKTASRRNAINNMRASLGIKTFYFVDGGDATPYTVGIANSHKTALASCKIPILILEDDAALTGHHMLTSFDIPDDADALYLGTSSFGRVYGGSHANSAMLVRINDNYNRVLNMLGMHAILYLSKRYINHTIDIMNQHMNAPVGGMDDRISETVHKFNVLALTKPMFYQNDGHSNEVTKTIINPIF